MDTENWIEQASIPKDEDHILIMLKCLSRCSITDWDNLNSLWQSMANIFGHIYPKRLIVIAIARSKFWELLLEDV